MLHAGSLRTAPLLLAFIATPIAAGAPAKSDAAQSMQQQSLPSISLHSSYVVKRSMASPRDNEFQVALISRASTGSPMIWIVEQWASGRRDGERFEDHRWADSRSCHALEQVLAQIPNIGPMRFAAPDAPPVLPPLHGAITTLTGVADVSKADGALSLSLSDAGRDGVSGWWRRAETALKPCWVRKAPVVDGYLVAPRLTSDLEARRQSSD